VLSDVELAALREAFRRVQERQDSRGFGHFASIHGIPEPGYCEHGNQLFLPWHRGYLYHFEQALQDEVAGVTLPWWDYTASGEFPEAYAAETDADGNPNPLASGRIEVQGGAREDWWPVRTGRAPSAFETRLEGGELPTEERINHVMGGANFDDFTLRLEDIHDAVHMWVGGEMTNQMFAAYDPIFWAHHAMVDRLWALWQLEHPGDNPRREHLGKGLNYFKDLTVADTLNVTDLGYDYAVAEVLVHEEDRGG
jgi:tyrosinase